MPSSATRTFTDPDMYFAGIRNLQINGVITKRGEFRAESTRIDLHRLWMHRIDERLPRIMRITPSGNRSLILFATNPLQPEMQVSGIETSQDQIPVFGLDWPYYLRSSAACGWGTMSLTPEDLAAASEPIIGHPLTPPSFPRWTSPPPSVASRLLLLHEAAGHLAKTAPDILAKPEVARAIEEALVEAMILKLKLTRFGGALQAFRGGFSDAQDTSAILSRVSPSDGRAGPRRPGSSRACPGV